MCGIIEVAEKQNDLLLLMALFVFLFLFLLPLVTFESIRNMKMAECILSTYTRPSKFNSGYPMEII